jgi:hypothetical protein
MTEIKLNRKQLNDLMDIVARFPEIDDFTITSDSSNGIGPVVQVKFMLFSNKASVDITDVESW